MSIITILQAAVASSSEKTLMKVVIEQTAHNAAMLRPHPPCSLPYSLSPSLTRSIHKVKVT